MNREQQIEEFVNKTQVSRETITSLKKFEYLLKQHNKKLNLIGNSTINEIWNRHFLDSAQIIDFIEKNDKIVTDLGSGAGFPGIVMEIMARDRKLFNKFVLIEKSPKKSAFLKNVIKDLSLHAQVLNSDLTENYQNIEFGVVTARAFKPLKFMFEFFSKKKVKWKKIFIFLGKTGKNDLLQASKFWDILYKQRVSITSADSLILEINKIKKKIE